MFNYEISIKNLIIRWNKLSYEDVNGLLKYFNFSEKMIKISLELE